VQGFVGAQTRAEEVFSDPAIMAHDGNQSRTRSRDIEQVYAHDENNPDKAYYGYDHVASA
jgi:hypothetical protein